MLNDKQEQFRALYLKCSNFCVLIHPS
jgi:hypothetical protein